MREILQSLTLLQDDIRGILQSLTLFQDDMRGINGYNFHSITSGNESFSLNESSEASLKTSS